jgi:hypothetical protein
MGPQRWFSKQVLAEIAGWLCLLAALALVALATSGALEIVLTLAAVIAWVVATGRPRGAGSAASGRERAAPLLVALAPALVGLMIAKELVSDEWYAFTAVAIAFPVMLIWRDVYGRWQDRRASHRPA